MNDFVNIMLSINTNENNKFQINFYFYFDINKYDKILISYCVVYKTMIFRI